MIDVDHLQKFDNPSRYRATLVVTPSTNRTAMDCVEQHGYRELCFRGD